MSSTTMTIRLDIGIKERLEHLATATHRSRSFLAQEAINEYLKLQEWQIKEIQAGLEEAERGNLIEHELLLKKWEEKFADSMDKTRQ